MKEILIKILRTIGICIGIVICARFASLLGTEGNTLISVFEKPEIALFISIICVVIICILDIALNEAYAFFNNKLCFYLMKIIPVLAFLLINRAIESYMDYGDFIEIINDIMFVAFRSQVLKAFEVGPNDFLSIRDFIMNIAITITVWFITSCYTLSSIVIFVIVLIIMKIINSSKISLDFTSYGPVSSEKDGGYSDYLDGYLDGMSGVYVSGSRSYADGQFDAEMDKARQKNRNK